MGRGRLLAIGLSVLVVGSLLLLGPPSGEEAHPPEVRIPISFSGPDIVMVGGLQTISMGDLPLTGAEGEPLLPCRPLKVLLPPFTDYRAVDIASSVTVPVGTAPDLMVGGKSSRIGEGEHEQGMTAPAPRMLYPDQLVEYTGTYLLHGLPVATFLLHPVSYNAMTGEVLYHESFEVTVRTTSSDAYAYSYHAERFNESVDNPWTLLEYQGITASYPSSLEADDFRYLIITSEALRPAFEPLLDWKTTRGSESLRLNDITATLVTVEEISSNAAYWGDPLSHRGTGNDTQNQIRNFIRDAYWSWGTEYVLLGGDTEVIPCRYVQVSTGYLSSGIPADLYYAGMDGSWDADGDGRYGEGGGAGGGSSGEEADLLLELDVGRAPVSTPQEAGYFVGKVIAYESSSGAYLNTSLMVGERLDSHPTWGGDCKDIVAGLIPTDDPEISIDRLYDRDGTFSKSSLVSVLNEGVHLINHMGHGSESTFAGMGSSDVSRLTNQDLFILYTQACLVGAFDGGGIAPQDSIMEHIVKAERGAVAAVANSREGWYESGGTNGPSQRYDLEFFKALFSDGLTSIGGALSSSKMNLLPLVENTGTMRWCYMSLNLLGDPEMEIHFLQTRESDVGVVSVEVGEQFKGEGGSITALIGNYGRSNEAEVPVELLVDAAVISTAYVSIPIGEERTVTFAWTPPESKFYQIGVRTNLSTDSWTGNDAMERIVEVVWRITGEESVTSDRTQAAGVLIESSGRLTIFNSTMTMVAPQHVTITVRGSLELSNASIDSSGPFGYAILGTEGSIFRVLNSSISGAIGEEAGIVMESSVISLEDLLVADSGRVQILSSAGMSISPIHLENSTGLLFAGCESSSVELVMNGTVGGLTMEQCRGMEVSAEIVDAPLGLLASNCSDIVLHDSMISLCDTGLLLKSTERASLLNLSLTGNGYDFGIDGEEVAHFLHEIHGSEVSEGSMMLLSQEHGFAINSSINAGYLAIVSCSNGRLEGLSLGGNAQGLLLVNCSGIEVTNSLLFENGVGLRALWSTGCSLHGNDFIANEIHAWDNGYDSYNASYPGGGNFWEGHPTPDLYSGPNQLSPGADGMGDHPFEVPGGDNEDRLPLVRCATEDNMPPVADFDHSPSPALTYQAIHFTDLSWDEDGVIISRIWNFGDGNTSHEMQPAHEYWEDGTYEVTLTVMDDSRNLASVTRPVEVVNRPPSADFSHSPQFPAVGEAVGFLDASDDMDGVIVGWSWDFGDGNVSDRQHPLHTFSVKGDYLVTLTVADNSGLSDSASAWIVVGNQLPQAAFSHTPDAPTTLDTVCFTDLSSDPDGGVVWWHWSFGDGHTSSQPSPTHRYSSLDVYTVTLKVKDDKGAMNECSRIIEVVNAPPVAEIGWSPVRPLGGVGVQFNDLSRDPDGTVISWLWDFGDGGSSEERHPLHTFAHSGEYEVTLIVWDDWGEWAKSTAFILVDNSPPLASFEPSVAEALTLTEIRFNDTSYDPDGTIVSWRWDFGDGNGSAERDPVHEYRRPGQYEVILTVIDDEGGENSFSASIGVLNRPPVVSFSWSVVDPYAANIVSFDGEVEDLDGSVAEVIWDFGDGNTSHEMQPEHEYWEDGTYEVSFRAVDCWEAEAEVRKEVVVELPDLELAPLGIEEEGGVLTLQLQVLSPDWYREEVRLEIYLNGLFLDSRSVDLSTTDRATVVVEVDGGENTISVVLLVLDEIVEADQDNNRLDVTVTVDEEDPFVHLILIGGAIIGGAIVGAVLLLVRRE